MQFQIATRPMKTNQAQTKDTHVCFFQENNQRGFFWGDLYKQGEQIKGKAFQEEKIKMN